MKAHGWTVAAVTGVMALVGCATAHPAPGIARSGAPPTQTIEVADLPMTQASPTSARVMHQEGETETVEFAAAAAYPNVRLVAGTPWNWEVDGGTTLVLDVTNPMPAAVLVGLRVDDGPMPNGDFIAVSALVPPGDHRVLLRLANVLPNVPYVLPAPSREPSVNPSVVVLHPRAGTLFNLSHVTAVTVYVSHPAAATTLTIHRLARESEAPALGFALVDR